MSGWAGVAYFENEHDFDLVRLGEETSRVIASFVQHHPHCRLIMKLGRYLTALELEIRLSEDLHLDSTTMLENADGSGRFHRHRH